MDLFHGLVITDVLHLYFHPDILTPAAHKDATFPLISCHKLVHISVVKNPHIVCMLWKIGD